MISLVFGANSFPESLQYSIINNENSSTAFDIPSTLRLIGIMADFQLENPNNPKTSGTGKFLNQDVSQYDKFYDSDSLRCKSFLLDPPPHDQSYFLRQLNAVGSYYENISNGSLSFEAHVILNSNSLDDGYYTVSEEMEYYAKGDHLLAEFFTEVIDIAKFDLESFFQDKSYSPHDVVFVVFHAGVGQEFSYPSLDPTIYDLKSAYIDEKMMGDIQPSIINQPINGNEILYEISTGILLPETQNLIYYDVVEDIFGNQDYGTEDLCDIQIGLTGVFALQLGYELGLPPMFNNDANSINYGDPGVGFFGLMDHGSNNGHGVIPAVPTPWTRIKAGWSNVNVINYNNNPDSLLIASLSQNKNAIYKINISDNEYFLIENRNNEIIPGFDIELLRYLLADNYLCEKCNLNCAGLDMNEIISNVVAIKSCMDEFPFSNVKLDYFEALSIINSQLEILSMEMENDVFSHFINYDIGLPGSGILIWHVVEPLESAYLIGVNNDSNNKSIQIEEADGAFDIGFESYLFMSNSNSYGWKWDFWYKDNPAFDEANPNSQKIIFNDSSYPNTKSSNDSESFLSFEILSEISDEMFMKIVLDDGMDVFHLSDEPIKYLGNMVDDLKGYVFYEKNGIIYKHSHNGDITVGIDADGNNFDFMEDEEKFIYSHESLIEYLEFGSCIDPFCLNFDNDLYSCGFFETMSDTTCLSGIQSLGDIDQDGLDEIITVENGRIIIKNHNGTLVDGFPVDGDFSGIPLVANIIDIEDEKPEIICRENEDLVILSNSGMRIKKISSFDSNQSLAMVPYWDDKMALIDGSRLLLFDYEIENSYWLNPQGRRSGLSTTDEMSLHVSSINTGSHYMQKAYNYPNPITEGKTTFRFFMDSTAGSVEIRIYDAAGFLIKDDLKKLTTTGNEYNEIQWNEISVDSGLYLAEIKREIGKSELVRLVVIK